jgi:ribosomal protein L19E
MGLISLLFIISIGLIAFSFIAERVLSSAKASTNNVFPHIDSWTARIGKLRDNHRQFSDLRRMSKKTYRDEYK